MKLSNTIIIVVVSVAVVLIALVIVLCIRGAGHRRADAVSQANFEQEGEQAARRLLPGGGVQGRFRNLSAEERAKIKEKRQKMIERMKNMSEEQKQAFRAGIRERFDAGRRTEQRGFRTLSAEERAEMREEWEKMRQRWENMSEQERQEFMANMRERFGTKQPVNEVNEVR